MCTELALTSTAGAATRTALPSLHARDSDLDIISRDVIVVRRSRLGNPTPTGTLPLTPRTDYPPCCPNHYSTVVDVTASTVISIIAPGPKIPPTGRTLIK